MITVPIRSYADLLQRGADDIVTLTRQRDKARAHRAMLWGACVALFLMFLAAASRPAPLAACETRAPDVMRLDPTEIRAAPTPVYEL